MKTTHHVSVIIPVHNRKEFTHACLRSLEAQTMTGFNTIVVDDGSTDGTREMLEAEFPTVKVLRGEGNLFWTAAINMGIRHALEGNADFILTMNNDTVATRDFIEKMMYWADRKMDALLGALDIDIKSGLPYYGGEWFDWKFARSRYLLDELPPGKRYGLHEVSLYPGRGLLIPAKVLRKIGLFDEKRLPHYLADYDYTQTARRRGFGVYCNYDAHLLTYPEEGGDQKLRKSKSLRNYFTHLFGMKGGGNLANYTRYIMKNCPRWSIPAALLTGYARRVGGYWLT